jgi:hypothetical protein
MKTTAMLCVAVFCLTILSTYAFLRLRSTDEFIDGFEIYEEKPVGLDLSTVLRASRAFLNRSSESADYAAGHPPFELLTLMPLSMLSHHRAYLIFGLALLIFFGGMIYFSLLAGSGFNRTESILISSVLAMGLFHTYPVLFAFERGNTDIIAGFFMALFLFGLKQEKALLAGGSLFCAIHFKIYPAILFPFFLFKFGIRKSALLGVFILSGFFVLGFQPLRGFHESIFSLQNFPAAWYGNHALPSWAKYQQGRFFNVGPDNISTLRTCLSAMFLFLLGVFGVKQWKKRSESDLLEAVLICSSFPLMSLLPGTSHDYRIAIYLVPFLFVLSSAAKEKPERTSTSIWFLVLISIITGLLFSGFRFFISKTESLLILYVALICYSIIRLKSPPPPADAIIFNRDSR